MSDEIDYEHVLKDHQDDVCNVCNGNYQKDIVERYLRPFRSTWADQISIYCTRCGSCIHKSLFIVRKVRSFVFNNNDDNEYIELLKSFLNSFCDGYKEKFSIYEDEYMQFREKFSLLMPYINEIT